MTKVALIYNQPLSSIDGASKVVSSFKIHSDILNKSGVEISIYAPDNSLGVSIKSKGFSLKRLIKNAVFKLDAAGVVRGCFNLCYRSRRAYNIYRTQSNEDYDVLFFHEIETCYHYLRSGKKKPVVLVLHTTGDFFSMDLSYHPLMRYTIFYNVVLKHIRKTILNSVDKIVFNSKMAEENFNRLYPKVRKGLATFVNNGVKDLDVISNIGIHPLKSPFRIICVGSVSNRKGQSFIVKALQQCDKSIRSKVKFVIVGDGPIREELEKKCDETGISASIEFCGVQKNVVPFLENADIFILPSVDEGMPIAILEAMRQGLPIVSTRVGGIPYQVVDGVTGVLIEASTNGVLGFLKQIDNYDWASMGKKSRERYLKEFSIEQMMNKYACILKDTAKCKNA